MTKNQLLDEIKKIEGEMESAYFSNETMSREKLEEYMNKLEALRGIRDIIFFKEVLEDDIK